MTADNRPNSSLKQSIKDEARRLGFVLAGVTSPDPPEHAAVFERWLQLGRHGQMTYLAEPRGRLRRSDPRLVMPECRSIVVLAIPYSDPGNAASSATSGHVGAAVGKSAAYAWGEDYHLVLPKRIKALVKFIRDQAGRDVSSLWYTDTGPILERDLAQRAGLGWIGKNTCLINPKVGSYVLLAEVFLDLVLEPDPPFATDHCGTCRRCIEACPTDCILPDRTLDARQCISYLTIELKERIPEDLRSRMDNWIFGCDICQMVCPWNRFAEAEGETAFRSSGRQSQPDLIAEMRLTSQAFEEQFKSTPIRRAKHSGYRRNVTVALGNVAGADAISVLEAAATGPDPMVAEHATWAIRRINDRSHRDA